MKKSSGIVLGIAAAVIVVIGLICALTYNGLAARDEAVDNAWTPLYTGLQLRYDAIPKLVNEIILYTQQEDEPTRNLAAARKKFMDAQSMVEKVSAANEVETAMDRLFIQEQHNYPGIQSHYQYMELMKDFDLSQQQINTAEKTYNNAVEKYNSYVRDFPTNIVAMLTGFKGRGVYFKKEGP